MAVDLTTGSYDEEGIFSKHNDGPKTSEKSATEDNMCSLKNFRTLRILKECHHKKLLVLEGHFLGDERPALVILEKMPFDPRDLSRMFTAESRLELKFRNNIYATYHVYPHSGFNGVDVKVIHPAQDTDFAKFIDRPSVMVNEDIKLYGTCVLPHFQFLSSEQVPQEDFNLENDEKLIFSDTSSGITFLKDSVDVSSPNKYVRAVCYFYKKGLLSLRDLTAEHIPLLLKMQETCLKKLTSLYDISVSKLESYVCYPPSTFPFHVIFESVEKDSPIPVEKAHHLETIISNLQLLPSYYQKISLTYSLFEDDPFLKKFLDVATDSNCVKN